MDTSRELEQWLRNEASKRTSQATSRRSYAIAGDNLTEEERKDAHCLAEQMTGRKLPKTTKAEDAKAGKIQLRIATKLDDEATMLLRFAGWVATKSEAPPLL